MVAVTEATRHARRVARRLKQLYPQPACALVHANPLELLVATILSAQCTDVRVNLVTPALFRTYLTAQDFAQAAAGELEAAIQSTGFFRAKARNIRSCCAALVANHGGHVPRDLEHLVALPGVGRKTANVVLGTAFGIAQGVVVDTHVGRLSRRLGLSSEVRAEKVERDLMGQLPRREWVDFSHRLILHGRRTCRARRPACEDCPLSGLCPRVGVVERTPRKKTP